MWEYLQTWYWERWKVYSYRKSRDWVVQEDKKVEEEILNRNIKLRAIDLLNGQSINKQFKDLKPGTTSIKMTLKAYL